MTTPSVDIDKYERLAKDALKHPRSVFGASGPNDDRPDEPEGLLLPYAVVLQWVAETRAKDKYIKELEHDNEMVHEDNDKLAEWIEHRDDKLRVAIEALIRVVDQCGDPHIGGPCGRCSNLLKTLATLSGHAGDKEKTMTRKCPDCGCNIHYEFEPANADPETLISVTSTAVHHKGCSQIPQSARLRSRRGQETH